MNAGWRLLNIMLCNVRKDFSFCATTARLGVSATKTRLQREVGNKNHAIIGDVHGPGR